MEHVERLAELGQTGVAATCVVQPHPLTQAGAVVSDDGLERREPGELRAQVSPSRAPAIRPAIQQRLSGSTTIRAGLGPKNLIGGGLLDPGPGRLIEDLEQGPGVPAGLEGRPPQRRHAGHRLRSGHDLQEPAGDAEADPLGLGDGGELVLRVAGDLHGTPQPLAEGPILGLLVGQASPQFLGPGLGRGAIDGLDDLSASR